MSLARGARFGPYEVIELLGEGGMGKVWRGRHVSLHRDDALKVLPDAFTVDPDRLARFNREAQILASLNHPNIAHVYGLEEVGDTRAIVMELVDGPTLADRLVRGPIPVDQALSIALQIARALEAAHQKSVIHRDLKPANIKVRPDGTVKVLDFGLAKALDAASSGAPVVSQSPTITSPAVTGQGVILGTAAYMSPEQAGGGPADQRSDVWAFGCVLYEMLTGKPPFPGDSVARVLARVLEREPDYTALPPSTPPRVKRAIRRCLEKDPHKRWHHVADVRLEIEDGVADDEMSEAVTPAPTTRRWRALPWAIGALAVGTGGMAGYLSLRSPAEEVGPLVRSTIAALAADEAGPRFGGLAISPDGQRIVYASGGRLLLRSLSDVESQPLRGSENGEWPAFSPDGESIAFFVPAESVIKRLPLGGGPSSVVTTTDAGGPFGLSWGPDGTIVFATATSEGLWRVRAAGGNPERLTMVNAAEAIGHRWPSVLPNGRGVLFEVFRGASARVGLVSLDDREVSLPVAVGGHPRFVNTGHIVYRDGGTLRAVGFDPERLVVTSDNPLTVAETVAATGRDTAAFDISGNGWLVHVPPVEVLSTLRWVSRDGREEPIDLPPLDYRLVQVSPDGNRIAANIQEGDRQPEIWVSDLRRRGWGRIPTPQQDGEDWFPKWTPDGKSLVFAIFGSTAPGLFSVPADGTGQVEHLLTIADSPFIDARTWSRDGQSLLFTFGNVAQPRIGLLSMQPAADGTRSWKPLVERADGTLAGPFSPDGRWLVTESRTSGSSSVYIERFPELGNRQPVSAEAGGLNAVWSPDGRELFYRRLSDDAMMAVRIQTSPSLSIGTPTVLFERRSYRRSTATRNWDVAPDGRFLLIKENTPVEASERPVILVQNWSRELTRAVPAK